MGKAITSKHTFPFQGGIDKVHEKPHVTPVALINNKIPVGISQAQNVRPLRPEFEQRGGMAKQHSLSETAWQATTAYSLLDFVSAVPENGCQYECTTAGTTGASEPTWPTTMGGTVADGSVVWTCQKREIISQYGFSKGRIDEISFFAQYNNGEVRKAGTNPPGTTTGRFGDTVMAARSGAFPGMFSSFKDYLVYTDGAGRAQIYTGENAKIYAFNVYRGTTDIPNVPEEGADYTNEVNDGLSSTYADLGSLDRLADNHCLFVITDVPIDKLNFAFSAWNSTEVGDLAVNYWNGTALTAVSGITDGTQGDGSGGSGTIEFGKDGSLTWASPTDELPYFAFGRSGFIYQISHAHVSATLDSTVQLTSLTCEYTGGFQDLQNVWDGIMIEAIEARVYKYDATSPWYETYSSQAIKAGALAITDYVYFNYLDPLFGIYLDVGKTPNTTATTVLDLVETWTGTAWTSVGASLDDGTTGGAKSGYVTWNRSVTPRKVNFNGSRYHSYWYRMSFDEVLSASLTWSILTMPYFNIDDIYPTVRSVMAWDKRLWYCFNDNYLYGTAQFNPTGLNGDDTVKIAMGDHRSNMNVCMRKFYNFCLVWQEEKGSEGGGFHLLEPGRTAAEYDAQIISPTIGIMNSKCAVVLEGATMTDLNNDRPVMTGAYFVSRLGVYKSDGSFLINISDGIGNYFDPERDECVRTGYEDKHFLALDSANGVLLMGIVSGSSATKPNKFFVLDPLTDKWTEDIWGYDISCVAEVGAASGNIPVIQLAGCQDGFVRQINTGYKDDGVDIVSNVVFEVDGNGKTLIWMKEIFRCKAQTSGSIVRTVAVDGNTDFDDKDTRRPYSMEPLSGGDTYRLHDKRAGDIKGTHLSIKYENETPGVPARYIDVGLAIDEMKE
ncbi:hypothetical protein KAR91_14715 [Candidatus Pacearchaeota archaeon]|nr:hypothetical protein [Candidatus Pacearchaeota archaeon]